MKKHKLYAALAAGALLAGCASNGTASIPSQPQTNLQSTTALQFAVGTANIGQTGTVGLNTVETFRQSNGLSATLVNTPTITGPTGFLVPASAPSADAGTTHISGAPQNVNPAITNPAATFGQSGGAFAYGFAPENIGTTGSASYSIYTQPFYSGSTAGSKNLRYVGAPPAYPFFSDGTFPSAFQGYPQGFTMFNAAPVAGSYSLSVVVAAGNAPAQTFTGNATLADMTPLAAESLPSFTQDGKGGGTVQVTIPSDSRIVETMVYFLDFGPASALGTAAQPAPRYYAVGPIKGAPGSTQTASLPDNLGPCSGSGCQNGSNATPTFNAGDAYRFYAASFDYPMFEASPPVNTQQKPTITGANGQADITTSAAVSVLGGY